jgi:hypothetical protein
MRSAFSRTSEPPLTCQGDFRGQVSAVATRYRHRFAIGSTRAVQRFVAEIWVSLAAGQIDHQADGVDVQPQIMQQA